MSILLAAVHMAKVDRQFVVEEHKLLAQLMSDMGLTEEERRGLLTEEAPLSEVVARLSSEEADQLLVKTMCAVASADGMVAESEKGFLNRVHNSATPCLDLPPEEDWRDFLDEVRAAFAALAT